MTKKQRIEHKIGNQIRKKILIARSTRRGINKNGEHYWALMGKIQNGKYTKHIKIKLA